MDNEVEFIEEDAILELLALYVKYSEKNVEVTYYIELGDNYSVKRKNGTSRTVDVYVEVPLTRNGSRRFGTMLRQAIHKKKGKTTFYINHE